MSIQGGCVFDFHPVCVCSTVGVVSTVRCSIPNTMGDIMINVGDILSTVACSVPWGISGVPWGLS